MLALFVTHFIAVLTVLLEHIDLQYRLASVITRVRTRLQVINCIKMAEFDIVDFFKSSIKESKVTFVVFYRGLW